MWLWDMVTTDLEKYIQHAGGADVKASEALFSTTQINLAIHQG